MRKELGKTGSVSLRHFYLRRVLRILPPFYLILGGAALVSALGISGPAFEARAVLAQALHYANYWIVLHGFQGFPAGTGVYWSLAVEEHFYLLFPWLFIGLEKAGLAPRSKVLVLLGICALSLLWRSWLVFGTGASIDRTSVATDTRFDSILFGCALALYENPVLDATAVREKVWKFVLLPLAGAVLLVTFVLRADAFRETFRYTLQGMALVPLFVCAMRYPEWGPMRLLNFRPVAFVGTLSYSLYLLHQVVLACVSTQRPGWGRLSTAGVALLISGLLAYAIYLAIEKPCAELRRRLQA
jgi:peptidoglycan/LPS O-acetylase OafA/YrhL